MARVLVATLFGCSLAWQRRLMDEGCQVQVVHVGDEATQNKRIGEGLVALTTYDKGFDWLKEGARLGEPVMALYDGSGEGKRADEMRKWGIPVVGGGSFCDRLEKDREFGFAIAQEAGCQLPPYQTYTSLTEAQNNPPDGPVYFKTDRYLEADATKSLEDPEHLTEYFDGIRSRYGDNIPHILQEKIEGVALSTARWWNGQDWVGAYECTYEHKAFMDGDLGGSTGCSFNAVYFYPDDPPIAEALGWERLSLAFRKHQAPPGLYDVNALVSEDGQVFFLEWTPRLGYDSELTSFRLLPDLSRHLFAVAHGHDVPLPSGQIGYSIRLSVPPYPYEHLKDPGEGADGTLVRGIDGLWEGQFIGYQLRMDPKDSLVVAGPGGLVGLSLAVGPKLSALHETAFEYAKGLHKRGITALQFRTDGADCIKEDAEKVKAAGHSIHKGLII